MNKQELPRYERYAGHRHTRRRLGEAPGAVTEDDGQATLGTWTGVSVHVHTGSESGETASGNFVIHLREARAEWERRHPKPAKKMKPIKAELSASDSAYWRCE